MDVHPLPPGYKANQAHVEIVHSKRDAVELRFSTGGRELFARKLVSVTLAPGTGLPTFQKRSP